MKSSLILGLSFAASAVLANPIQKRAEVTDFVFETVYVTVTADETEPTSTTSPSSTTDSPTAQATEQAEQSQTLQAEQSQTLQASSSPSSDSSSVQAAKPISNDYVQGLLDAHNNHRQNHTVDDLVWSQDLADIAKQIGQSCVYAHDTKTGGGGYGQNIGAGAPDNETPKMITNAMYNDEIGYYPGYNGEPSMNAFEKWGHFSQIVWKSTKEVGCATVYCPGGLANTGSNVSPYFTVCNYRPVGNVAGQYGGNVLQPKGMATVHL